MLTEQDLLEQREQIQEDAACILDGVEDEDNLLNLIEEMVFDRFQILLDKLKKEGK